VPLAELRALAAVHGPLALVQLDAHHDVWDEYFGQKLFHGSVVRRAAEEGLLDPARSVQAGMRGSLTAKNDAALPAELGFDALPYEELAALGPAAFADRLRSRVGDAPCFLSCDVDFVDPASCREPAPLKSVALRAGRPSPTSVRSQAWDFRGFDCVEVSPPYDRSG